MCIYEHFLLCILGRGRQLEDLCIGLDGLGLSSLSSVLYLIFIYLFIFREGEGGSEASMCGCSSHMPSTGDLAWSLGMGPDWVLNPPHCFAGWCSVHRTTPARALYLNFVKWHYRAHKFCLHLEKYCHVRHLPWF